MTKMSADASLPALLCSAVSDFNSAVPRDEALGLHSQHHHAPAAYTASICSFGLGFQTNNHLCSAVADFNSVVPPNEVVETDSLLSPKIVETDSLLSPKKKL